MWSQLCSFFLPEHCVICGCAGNALCRDCLCTVTAECAENEHDPDLRRLQLCEHCQGEWPVGPEGTQCPRCSQSCNQVSLTALGWRDELVGRLAETLKFAPRPALARPLAFLLARVLYPVFTADSSANLPILVPIPTSRRHRAERGFDHAALVTHELARVFRTESHPLLIRAGNTVQVGAGREQRQQQAAAAFTCPHALNPNATYLLYDDITTTGSTLTAAAQVLQAAGARRVIVAVLAKSR